MKIAFFEVKKEEIEFFSQNLKGYQIEFFKEPIHKIVTTKKEWDIVSVFINSKITNNILDNLPNLKYIQTRSTGYDHLECLKIYNKNIIASNVVGYAKYCVSEFSFGLLLEAIRKINIAINRVKNNNLNYLDLKGSEIYNKNIGILGLGDIGLNIAKIANGFGANIYGYSRTKKDIFKQLNINFTSLEEVLEKSDYLFISLPLTPLTRNLINKNNINYFKGKVIINTARAQILDNYIYENFDGIIATDVLDNWELAKKENIIATPHMAYYTKEAIYRIMEISLNNIYDFLNNKTPRNCLKLKCQKDYKESK